jgi:hypothetical protein
MSLGYLARIQAAREPQVGPDFVCTGFEHLHPDYQRRGLGSLTDALTSISNAITGANRALSVGAIPAAADVLADPALPAVIEQVTVLRSLQTSSGGGPGIGLSNVVTPLKVYVATQRSPWIIPAAVVVLLGVPFMLGRASK